MSDIRFYIPKSETIPTELRLYVNDIYVTYEPIVGGFVFHIGIKDEEEALKIAKEIANRIMSDHSEPEHGVSWRSLGFNIISQDERYKIDTIVEWKYRVRDSY